MNALKHLQAEWDAAAALDDVPMPDSRPTLRGIIGGALLLTVTFGVWVAAFFSIGG